MKEGFLLVFFRINPAGGPQQIPTNSKVVVGKGGPEVAPVATHTNAGPGFARWQRKPRGSPSSLIAMLGKVLLVSNGFPEVAPVAP